MAKNKIIAKNKRPASNKATGRDYSYDKEYQKGKVSYRQELNAEARKKGIYGKRNAAGRVLTSLTRKSGKMVIRKRKTHQSCTSTGS
jgi:hypothetical protein